MWKEKTQNVYLAIQHRAHLLRFYGIYFKNEVMDEYIRNYQICHFLLLYEHTFWALTLKKIIQLWVFEKDIHFGEWLCEHLISHDACRNQPPHPTPQIPHTYSLFFTTSPFKISLMNWNCGEWHTHFFQVKLSTLKCMIWLSDTSCKCLQ